MSTAVDFAQFQRVGRSIADRINSTETAVSVMNEMYDAAMSITKLLPPATLNWRISRWFGDGNFLMKDRFKDIQTPCLILSGKNDRVLPSRNEGRRLARELKRSAKVQLKEYECGHALLDGTTIDFGEEIMSSEVFSPPINPLDAPTPTEKDVEDFEKQFGGLLNTLSTVFLTQGEDGYLRRGIDTVPLGKEGRPVLLVGNHQLLGNNVMICFDWFLCNFIIYVVRVTYTSRLLEP
jgi:hypothetical protein